MSFRRAISLFNLFTNVTNYNRRVLPCSQRNFIKFRYYSNATELPNKVELLLSKIEKIDAPQTSIATEGVTTEIKQVIGSLYGVNYRLKWMEPPRSVLVVKKPLTESTDKAFVDIVSWLHEYHPNMNILVEPEVAKEFEKELPYMYVISKERKDEYARIVDFVITLGGDGTILHVSSLFNQCVPPVISFSMGTLGFLLPFHIHHYKSALEDVIKGNVSLLLRMRLACSMWTTEGERFTKNGIEIGDLQAMNEVNLHRGRYPHLNAIECFVDGQFLTDAVADGLIVATPTGSTAYSLSAGGPIIHPSVQSLIVTPICPRSLSFRPVLLPPGVKIQLRIGEESRAPTEVTVDGREICMLDKGEWLEVQMSPYPIPCVNRVDEGVDWVKDINDLLKWNQNFVNKQFLIHGINY
ncbi:ATP-NAD kinase-like domain-containing protein [Glomus cerebriforme]|uniref:ATP-NAD kinase-like domain-containing protein n=1 Tax=Glomus cerebriforme TaxID=658196 RepID=A0A397S862_9GLOM|nr:ATP-NAD kinase-like domain-containing protein [Glomus cerebriforme]